MYSLESHQLSKRPYWYLQLTTQTFLVQYVHIYHTACLVILCRPYRLHTKWNYLNFPYLKTETQVSSKMLWHFRSHEVQGKKEIVSEHNTQTSKSCRMESVTTISRLCLSTCLNRGKPWGAWGFSPSFEPGSPDPQCSMFVTLSDYQSITIHALLSV
jgi:hypothetical protein